MALTPRTGLLVAVIATLCVFAALCTLNPMFGVVYLGTIVQVGVFLLVPVDGGTRR